MINISYSGSTLALGVATLIGLGFVIDKSQPNYIEDAVKALNESGQIHLLGAALESEAVNRADTCLRESKTARLFPPETVIEATAAKMLAEVGGILGLESLREQAEDEGRDAAYAYSRTRNDHGNVKDLDTTATADAPNLDDLFEGLAKDAGMKVRFVNASIDKDGNVTFDGDVPAEIADLIRQTAASAKS